MFSELISCGLILLEIGLQKSIVFIYMVGELLLKYFLALQFSLKDELDQKMRCNVFNIFICVFPYFMNASSVSFLLLLCSFVDSVILCCFSIKVRQQFEEA
jgi:hypothetical protein